LTKFRRQFIILFKKNSFESYEHPNLWDIEAFQLGEKGFGAFWENVVRIPKFLHLTLNHEELVNMF
jgi:hypothetical protein